MIHPRCNMQEQFSFFNLKKWDTWVIHFHTDRYEYPISARLSRQYSLVQAE